MVEFSNTAIWEVPLRMTPVQFLQELEKHYTGNAAHPYFSNTAIWEVPLRMTPVQFLQELEKHYTGNAAHPYYCLPPTLRHPFQVKYLGDIIPIKQKTEGMSGTGVYWMWFN